VDNHSRFAPRGGSGGSDGGSTTTRASINAMFADGNGVRKEKHVIDFPATQEHVRLLNETHGPRREVLQTNLMPIVGNKVMRDYQLQGILGADAYLNRVLWLQTPQCYIMDPRNNQQHAAYIRKYMGNSGSGSGWVTLKTRRVMWPIDIKRRDVHRGNKLDGGPFYLIETNVDEQYALLDTGNMDCTYARMEKMNTCKLLTTDGRLVSDGNNGIVKCMSPLNHSVLHDLTMLTNISVSLNLGLDTINKMFKIVVIDDVNKMVMCLLRT
jgi:hypothetical protein